MANDPLPITPSVLEWARERAGLRADQLRSKFPKFDAWADGSGGPTYPQLAELGRMTATPTAVFFFPEPPRTEPVRGSFRTLPDTELVRLPPRLRLLLRKALALRLNLAELHDGRNPAGRQILQDLAIGPEVPVQAAAVAVRRYLGVSIEEQMAWPDARAALESWRNAFEAVGIAVFKDAFGLEAYSGFCLYHRTFPLIYVNNSSALTRQIFTLFHELAHLLYRTSGLDPLPGSLFADLSPEGHDVEVACNRFAAEFLLPNARLAHELRGAVASEETAARIAHRYNVSRELVFRRFLDRGLVGRADYQQAALRWQQQRRRTGGDGGNYYATKLTYLGPAYVRAALSSHRRNRISEDDLAEYLDLNVANIPALEDHLLGGLVPRMTSSHRGGGPAGV